MWILSMTKKVGQGSLVLGLSLTAMLSSGKYANWDPSVSVKLGAYGRVSRETGQFESMGSISEGEFAQRHAPLLATLGKPATYPPDDFQLIQSGAVAKKRIGPEVDISLCASPFNPPRTTS
jgi:hypothetical protein